VIVDTAGRLHDRMPQSAGRAARPEGRGSAEGSVCSSRMDDGAGRGEDLRAGSTRVSGLTGVILTKLDWRMPRGGAAPIDSWRNRRADQVRRRRARRPERARAGSGSRQGWRDEFSGRATWVALVEKAAATVDAASRQALEQKVLSKKGMDLQDFLVALKQMQSMGPLKQGAWMLPGINAKALQGVSMDRYSD